MAGLQRWAVDSLSFVLMREGGGIYFWPGSLCPHLIIFDSQLVKHDADFRRWVIAHEIAQGWRQLGGSQSEVESRDESLTDDLARHWGFPIPERFWRFRMDTLDQPRANETWRPR